MVIWIRTTLETLGAVIGAARDRAKELRDGARFFAENRGWGRSYNEDHAKHLRDEADHIDAEIHKLEDSRRETISAKWSWFAGVKQWFYRKRNK